MEDSTRNIKFNQNHLQMKKELSCSHPIFIHIFILIYETIIFDEDGMICRHIYYILRIIFDIDYNNLKNKYFLRIIPEIVEAIGLGPESQFFVKKAALLLLEIFK